MRISVVLICVFLALGAFALYETYHVSNRTVLKDTIPTLTTAIPTTASTTNSTVPVATSMRFEVVNTLAAQEQGLGGRATIPDNYGMLFVFPKDDRYGFWMKDMLVSIDMIWLSDKGDIILIDDSVAADTYPHVFYPPQPVKYVLETKAGFAKEHGWSVGTHVTLPSPYGT